MGYFIANVSVLGTIVKDNVWDIGNECFKRHSRHKGSTSNHYDDENANPKHDIEGRVVKLVGDTTVKIPAWCSCELSVSGLRCTGNAMVEPLDGTLTGGLLHQTGLVGSIEGRFEVKVRNPTSDTTRTQSRRTVRFIQQRISIGIQFPEGWTLCNI